MRKLFKERKLIKGGNYMRKYGIQILDLTQPWDLLRSYLRALTQTYIMVAKFHSVFSRV